MGSASGGTFWEITVSGSSTIVEYGPVGTSPRTSEKDHGSVDKANEFAASQIKSKEKKGYAEVTSKEKEESGEKADAVPDPGLARQRAKKAPASTPPMQTQLGIVFPVCPKCDPYGRLSELDQLRKLLVVAAEGEEEDSLLGAFYSWLDLDMEGCISPRDYTGLRPLIDSNRLHLTFLWGAVEYCALLWQPPCATLEQVPPTETWPVLYLDNENSLTYYAPSFRAAVIKMLSEEEHGEEDAGTCSDVPVGLLPGIKQMLGLDPKSTVAAEVDQPLDAKYEETLKLLQVELENASMEPWAD
jgi:predicted DNA-binding WGR domain protein